MKKINLLFLVSVTAMLIQSCAVSETWRINEKSATRDLQGRGSDVSVVVKPVMADLDVEKARKESTYIFDSDTLGYAKSKIAVNSGAKESAKSFALFQYMKDNNCDYVLDPMYHISRSGNSNSSTEKITVTISGYPAKYKNFYQPDTLPRSIAEGRDISKGSAVFANSQIVTKEKFKPFFATGLGLNYGFGEGTMGLPDIHARYYAARFLSIGYDFMNMREYYGTDLKSKNHIFNSNLNLYNKSLNGLHFTSGFEIPTYDGFTDFDGFGLVFGTGAQYIVANKIAIRGDIRFSTTFGGSFGLGASYCFR
jgi:hypothetical protein